MFGPPLRNRLVLQACSCWAAESVAAALTAVLSRPTPLCAWTGFELPYLEFDECSVAS